MNYALLALVLLYEIVVIVGLGVFLQIRRTARAHQSDEFALAGRDMPLSVLSVTLALTVLGTAHILGVFEMTWAVGAAAVWFSIAHVILLVLVCLGTGVWVRRLGVVTVPELLERIYGRETRLLVTCVMAGVLFGILTVEAQGIGIIFASLTDWSIQEGALVGGVLGILYVVLAGMKEIGWVNLVNAVIMYAGLILATIFIALRLPDGGFEGVTRFFEARGDARLLSIFGDADIMLTFGLGTVVAVVFSQSVNQMLLQPAMSARNEATIRRAMWIAAPINGLFGVFAVVIGLAAQSVPEFEALGPKVAATSMLVAYLPNWLAALLLAAFLAAILSTFAVVALAIATMFSSDVVKALYAPDMTERGQALFMRAAIVVVGGVAISVAALLPPILAAMNWLFAWLAPIFFILVAGLFWKRSQAVAIATLAISWIVNSIWSFTDLPAHLGVSWVPNAYVTALLALGVTLVGNFMVRGKDGLFAARTA